MARTLLLLRHGQTEWNTDTRAQGHTDIPLDETGRLQAKSAAAALAAFDIARIWASDLSRAAQTARIVAESTGVSLVLDPRLREYDVGARAGLTPEEFAERFPEAHAAWQAGRPEPTVPGEESTAQVGRRVDAALRDYWTALADGETGLVVAHGGCIKTGIVAHLSWPASVRSGIRGLDNCCWTSLIADSRGVRLGSYNVQGG